MSEQTHRMEPIFSSRLTHLLRIKMRNSEVFCVKEFYQLDKSIYDLDGGWSGLIVASENLTPLEEKLFRPGSGIDFYEEDIEEIFDETTSEVIYSRKEDTN